MRHNERKSIGIIKAALAQMRRPYVACSFGKDSSVLLSLCLKIRPDIDVVFARYPETSLLDNYEEVIAGWKGIRLHYVDVEDDILDETGEGDFMDDWAIAEGFDGFFMGLRKQESRGRRITLLRDGAIYRKKNGLLRCCPLADWSSEEVLLYCIENALPMLSSYSGDVNERSVTSLAHSKYGMRERQLLALKRRDPSKFNLLLQRFPTLAKYV